LLELIAHIAEIWTACSVATVVLLTAIIRRRRSPRPQHVPIALRSVRPPV
jgi:hypothetical protein